MADLIERQAAIDAVSRGCQEFRGIFAECEKNLNELPSAQPDFNITVKIDKAYDDGYEAGYLQGRHDWGDLDE